MAYWQNNNFARASPFFVHFFSVTAQLRREKAYFHVLWWTRTKDNDGFLFLFATPEKIANIWWIERGGISAIKFEAARLHFLIDVFVAFAARVA